MFEETAFGVREEADDFLILTCPWCTEDIMFTQFADPGVVRETVNHHAQRCSAGRVRSPQLDVVLRHQGVPT